MTGLFAATGFAVLFGLLSYTLGWLTAKGSLVASLFGFSLIYWGGIAWIAPVLVFFITSSAFSKIGREQGKRKQEDIRNAVQVLANGGIGWMLLLAQHFVDAPVLYAGFIGAFAAATADTWATEVGRLAGGIPRSVVSGRLVEKGASGGITLAGTLAALTGSLLIGSILALFSGECWASLVTGSIAGMSGCFLDSVLGATLQVRYRDEATGAVTESPGGIHHMGWRWMTNDTVNLFCTLSGALIGMGAWQLLT